MTKKLNSSNNVSMFSSDDKESRAKFTTLELLSSKNYAFI